MTAGRVARAPTRSSAGAGRRALRRSTGPAPAASAFVVAAVLVGASSCCSRCCGRRTAGAVGRRAARRRPGHRLGAAGRPARARPGRRHHGRRPAARRGAAARARRGLSRQRGHRRPLGRLVGRPVVGLARSLLLVLTASETVGVPLAGLTAQDLARPRRPSGRVGRCWSSPRSARRRRAGCARARTSPGARRLLLLAGAGAAPDHADRTRRVRRPTTSWPSRAWSCTSSPRPSGRAVCSRSCCSCAAPRSWRPPSAGSASWRWPASSSSPLSGLLSAYERLGRPRRRGRPGYGALVLAKTAALVVLGAMGWQHRRRLVPALAAGRPGAFLSFAGVELSVMGGAFALAVALSRTPTPATRRRPPDPSPPTERVTRPCRPRVEPVSLTRPAARVAGQRRRPGRRRPARRGLRRRRAAAAAAGTPWPRRRSAAFAGALAVAAARRCAAASPPTPPRCSACRSAQFVLLLVVVPALLVLGAPLELLARRPRAGRDAARRTAVPGTAFRELLTDPLTGMVAGRRAGLRRLPHGPARAGPWAARALSLPSTRPRWPSGCLLAVAGAGRRPPRAAAQPGRPRRARCSPPPPACCCWRSSCA